MNVITDIGSELAVAFLVEKKHSRRIAMRDAVLIIDRVQAELQTAEEDDKPFGRAPNEKFEAQAFNR